MKLNYKQYRIGYVDYPEYPEVEKFVSVPRGMVLINRCAAPGAKVIRLIFY